MVESQLGDSVVKELGFTKSTLGERSDSIFIHCICNYADILKSLYSYNNNSVIN